MRLILEVEISHKTSGKYGSCRQGIGMFKNILAGVLFNIYTFIIYCYYLHCMSGEGEANAVF